MRPIAFRCLPLLALLAAPASAQRGSAFLDNAEDPSAWRVVASEGVEARLSAGEGVEGDALRFDYTFSTGAGFAILRRDLELPLAENYRVRFDLRGEGRPNNLELKLVGPSGDDVWWVNRRNYRPPTEWTRLQSKRRHFEFAWGPSGGAPLQGLSALEFAVAAGQGGEGTLWIDNISIEPLPPDRPYTGTPALSATSGADTIATIPDIAWTPAPDDPRPTLTLDFGLLREFGGLTLNWAPGAHAKSYTIELSDEGEHWRTVRTVADSAGGVDHHPLPESESRWMRLRVDRAGDATPITLNRLRVRDVAFAASMNDYLMAVAQESPEGLHPATLLGRQVYWTLAAAPDGLHEALMNEHGAVEAFKGAFTVEPFIRLDGGTLVTWADADPVCSLDQEVHPTPAVGWRTTPIDLLVTAVADPAEDGRIIARYRLTNMSTEPRAGRLALALRPVQALPPWQFLNQIGGFTPIESLDVSGASVLVNGRTGVRFAPATAGASFAAWRSDQGDAVERLADGAWTGPPSAQDPLGLATGLWSAPFNLAPGASVAFDAEIRREACGGGSLAPDAFDQALARSRAAWEDAIGPARIELPASARDLALTYRAQLAYILANRDGPAIHPGSRTYERSWIRDGALTSLALLGAGYDRAVADYIDWYAPNQFPSGKVPCVVDERGPDPVPEHDSHGQLIFAIASYHRFTGDDAFAERHYARVVRACDYMDALVAQRSTPEYANADGIKGACFGLVPESISHEGYAAKPMHSYWDGFFVIRGYRDAAYLARVLGRTEDAERFELALERYRWNMWDSFRDAMEIHGIDYLSGCVELGDFDATSTSIGVFPIGERDRLPQDALRATFDRYMAYFRDRRDGRIEWRDYTPYEVRIVATLALMDRTEEAHELLRYFFEDRRPTGWRHWAEVVHREPDAPRFIGDMPHTWVGSGYVNSLRALLAWEDEDRERLILGLGVPMSWAQEGDGVAVRELPTWHGLLTYRLSADENGRTLTLDLRRGLRTPAGGVWLRVPGRAPIESASDQRGRELETEDRLVRLPERGGVVTVRLMGR